MRRLIGAIVGGGIAVFAGTTAMDDDTTRDGDGVIVDGGGLGVFQLRIGDCVQLPDEELVMSIEGVPCDEPHVGQVYDEFELRDGSYPGVAEVDAEAFDGCVERWPAALESVWDTDPLYDLSYLTPTEDGWSAGDHEVTCVIVRVDGGLITGDVV